jgi:hypothetical protein
MVTLKTTITYVQSIPFFLGANSWLANLNKCLTGAVFWKVTFADWGDSRQHHFAGN